MLRYQAKVSFAARGSYVSPFLDFGPIKTANLGIFAPRFLPFLDHGCPHCTQFPGYKIYGNPKRNTYSQVKLQNAR